jgi:hypothetical protein
MDLKPEESAAGFIPVPPEVLRLIMQGGSVEVAHGPVMEISPDHYERLVEISIDGEPVMSNVIAWEAKERLRYRLLRWLTRKPRELPDVRIQLGPLGVILPGGD